MKKILITGKDSYIGNKLIEFTKDNPNYQFTVIDTITNEWENTDFSGYDSIFHVAGIVHDMNGKIKKEIYFEVNCDLALKIAQKAKESGVKHFIFMSSLSIYNAYRKKTITNETIPQSKDAYGQSKLKADNLLQKMQNDEFKVAIVRPPMIFGENCKGNFPILIKFAKRTKIFPKLKNQRSMIYIDNFSQFIKDIIDNQNNGIFFPQNEEYFCTSQIIKTIADYYEKKIWMPRIFNPLVWILVRLSDKFDKVFGDLIIDCNEFRMKNVNNNDSIIRSISNK